MGCILNLAASDKFFLGFRETVVHCIAADEGGGADGHLHFLIAPVVVEKSLFGTSRYTDSKKGSDFGGIQVIQSSVDMPAIASCILQILLLWDGMFMEGAMVRMFKSNVVQSFK